MCIHTYIYIHTSMHIYIYILLHIFIFLQCYIILHFKYIITHITTKLCVYIYIIHWYPLHGVFPLFWALSVTPSPSPWPAACGSGSIPPPRSSGGCQLLKGWCQNHNIYIYNSGWYNKIYNIIQYIYMYSIIFNYNRFHIIWVKYLVGGWPTPLKNMKVSWSYSSQYIET